MASHYLPSASGALACQLLFFDMNQQQRKRGWRNPRYSRSLADGLRPDRLQLFTCFIGKPPNRIVIEIHRQCLIMMTIAANYLCLLPFDIQ